jgi:2-polyprenyl-3-methyl-5-hydroxy-6-metoxy-1,4-benzoquinol methylase
MGEDAPQGAIVLDLGCGSGVPISQAIADEGLTVYGVDASPSMIAAFRAWFPEAAAECRRSKNPSSSVVPSMQWLRGV